MATRASIVAVALLVGSVVVACGSDDTRSPAADPTATTAPGVVTTSTTTTTTTESPPSSSSSPTTSTPSGSTVSVPTSTPPSTSPSVTVVATDPPWSVTVTDPAGDVVVANAHRRDAFPAQDARADLLGYTLSWTEVVTFELTTAQLDPTLLDEVALAFDIEHADPTSDRPIWTDPDGRPVPEFVIWIAIGGEPDALMQLHDTYTKICPVRRSVSDGAYVIEFDASCLGDAIEIHLRPPYAESPWWVTVGDPPCAR